MVFANSDHIGSSPGDSVPLKQQLMPTVEIECPEVISWERECIVHRLGQMEYAHEIDVAAHRLVLTRYREPFPF